jgi:hypothetical protein
MIAGTALRRGLVTVSSNTCRTQEPLEGLPESNEQLDQTDSKRETISTIIDGNFNRREGASQSL